MFRWPSWRTRLSALAPLTSGEPSGPANSSAGGSARSHPQERVCLEAAIHQYGHVLVTFFFRMLGDQQLAERLTEETLLKITHLSDRSAPPATEVVAVYRIAVEAGRHVQTDPGTPAPIQDLSGLIDGDPGVGGDAIRRATGQLPMAGRVALILHKYQGLTPSEIAEVLSISETAARREIFSAYQSIRNTLFRTKDQ